MDDAPAVMVLGAGLGTRLRPLTEVCPKPVAPLLGEPLVGTSLARVAAAGWTAVVVNAHHLAERLVADLSRWAEGRLPTLDLRFSVERPRVLGTGGALVEARPLLGDGPVAVINGDILCDVDLAGLWRRHRESGAAATLLLVEHPEVERFGAVSVDDAGRVIDLAGLGRRRAGAAGGSGGAAVARGVFAGVHLVEPEVFDHLPPSGESCVVRQGYVPMMEAGLDVRGVLHRGGWNDLGTIGRYLQTHVDLLRSGLASARRRGLLWSGFPPRVPGRALAFGLDADGTAYGDRDAVALDEGAVLRGPVALGEGARVGRGASLGPDVYVAAGAAVGSRASVERAVLWPGARLTDGASVRGAVCFARGGRQRVVEATA